METRKVTYRMYPKPLQSEALNTLLGLHQRVYNTALEERIRVYRESGGSLGFSKQCRELTQWRRRVPALKAVNAQSLQVTLKRLSLAFDAFFRRVAEGEGDAGFPRFKSVNRFSGWGYKTHGDGWTLHTEADMRHGSVRLSGVGNVALRGCPRTPGTPKTAEVMHKDGKWYLSVTLLCEPERQPGVGAAAFDWGVKTLLTVATSDNKTELVQNPRWLKSRLERIKTLQQAIAEIEAKIKLGMGFDPAAKLPPSLHLPKNASLRRLEAKRASLHGRVARQRRDFYHKLTSKLVSRFALLGSEQLAVTAMVRSPKPKADPEQPVTYLANGAAAKAGLDRSILDAAPSMLLGMLKYKAAEAGTWFALADTRQLKPTQRCHRCGAIVKKILRDRVHVCACGCVCDRDVNAAKVILRWMLEGDSWFGTSQANHSPETPPVTASAVRME